MVEITRLGTPNTMHAFGSLGYRRAQGTGMSQSPKLFEALTITRFPFSAYFEADCLQ